MARGDGIAGQQRAGAGSARRGAGGSAGGGGAVLRGRADAGGDRARDGTKPAHHSQAIARVPRLRPRGAGRPVARRRRPVNLDLGGPGPGCSALRVRRLLAGELSGVEKERTEAHVAGCARCAAVQQEIAAEREALRRDVPFPQFAAAVAEKLAHRPQRSLVSRWAPLAAAAGLLLDTGTVLVLRPTETETVRPKGAASAQLFVQDKSG